MPFRKTKNESQEAPRFKVSLGVIPDYLYDGKGMRIDGVSQGRPAEKAGFQKGDIVIKLGDEDITDMMSYMKALSKYKKGDKLKVKVLEIKVDQQKVRAGLKQTQIDPFSWFKDKKLKDRITVKVISSDNKGLIVKPEGCEIDFTIKKSQIAINAADARPSRFVGGERIDAAIAELDISKRKVSLSIKLLEELTSRIRYSDQQIESLSLSDAEQRICIALIRLAEELGQIKGGTVTINNLPYHQDIANMAGTSRETVSRVLKILENKNMISKF